MAAGSRHEAGILPAARTAFCSADDLGAREGDVHVSADGLRIGADLVGGADEFVGNGGFDAGQRNGELDGENEGF